MTSLFACDREESKDTEELTEEITDICGGDVGSETDEGEYTEMLESGIKLTDTFSFVARSDDDKVRDLEYIKVSDVDTKYVSEENGYFLVDYKAPCFEIGGITHPDKNGGILYRLDASKLSTYEKTLKSSKNATKYAYDTAGVTIRFCTTADKIKIKSSVAPSVTNDTTAPRGTYGLDVYVGTGTDRIYNVARLEQLTDKNLDKEVSLPTGRKEVIIYLPTAAAVKSFKIGFANKFDRIALPTERDHAPIAFYGSAATQGLSATRVSISYPSLACRMLNADCRNLGFLDGADGEAEIAEYIASLGELSAFVMEYDAEATPEELEANHYNFYKTVRDAYPEIPIVIMSQPIFSADSLAAREEKLAVIKKTVSRAISGGDKLVYFLDGADIFPMSEELVDIYTSDMETPNDLGHQYIAYCIYDILNSAFTPDSEKAGTDRKPGLRDAFDFVSRSDDEKLETLEYKKVSEIDSKYVNSTVGGVTYLKYSTPEFEIGGIKHPDENGGEFYRLNVSDRDRYETEIIAWNSIQNSSKHTTGATIRFATDADEIVIEAKMRNAGNMVHMTNRGINGFDVYVGSGTRRVYCGTAGQDFTGNPTMKETVKLPEGYKEVMIEFPMYGGVEDFNIGFSDPNAKIASPLERDHLPVLFYGSSVTQGCSASRPGTLYTNMICRMLNTDCVNEAYSGSGRGDQIMAEYIGSRELSVAVIEYDDNSSIDELRERHYDFYKTIREAQPNLPIVIIVHPYFTKEGVDYYAHSVRTPIIKATYDKAIAEGDKNVYYIDPLDYYDMTDMADIYCIDFAHPTDTGFYYMGVEVYELLKDILNK